jgi:DNA-binding transcriptional LysR family regulator
MLEDGDGGAQRCRELQDHGGEQAQRGGGAPQIAAVAALAGAGLGPALVPANILSGPMRAAARSLDPPRARELCAFTRSAWSPLARAFLDVMAEQPWPGLSPGAVGVS